jgi:DNA helicase TIP49 (TBP-interacting protein)
MTAIELPDDLVALGAYLRRQFRTHATKVNSTRGMWQDLVDAVAVVKRIEQVALSMTGVFSAKDVRKIVGDKVNVTPVLTNLCKRELLQRIGEKRGTRYAVAPKKSEWWMIERDD